METTDIETDILLFAKEQGIDINALNLLMSRITSESEIAPCAHYLGFRDITSIDKLCTEPAHNGVPCPLNADGEWTIYSNGQEKLNRVCA